MYRYTLHIPALDVDNDRRTVYVIIDPAAKRAGKRIWHWASIEISLDQLDADDITEEQRKKGYDRGTLYWSLIQDAEWCARWCIGAHLGELDHPEWLHVARLKILHDELKYGFGLMLHESWVEAPEARDHVERIIRKFPDFLDLRMKTKRWVDYVGRLLQERERLSQGNHGRPGYVYLLRSASRHWKIGRTVNPRDRLKTFGVQLPFEVRFEHIITVENMAAAEAALHARFASKRVKGEWFALTEEDVNEIKRIDWM